MRPWRSWWANLVVVLAVLTAGGGLPWVAALALAVGVVKLDKWVQYRRTMRWAEEPVANSELVVHVQEVCERIGLADLGVVAVQGTGGPYINLHDGCLYVSAEVLNRLTPAELEAAILHRAVTPASQGWRLELEPHLPWGALAMGLALLVKLPVISFVFFAALMIWCWSQGIAQPYCPRLARDHFQAFLERGGDGPALVRALMKNNWHIAADLPQGSIQDRFAARAWATLVMLGDMCGMTEADLEQIADANGLSDLYRVRAMSVWHRMGFARAIFVYTGVVEVLPLIYIVWSTGRFFGVR